MCSGSFTGNKYPVVLSTTSDFPTSPGSHLSQRGSERSEFPWKPFLWPSRHVISQVGCNQTPTGQRMSSQTSVLGFHPNYLHFLFKLVISHKCSLCPSQDLLGRGSPRHAPEYSPGPWECSQAVLSPLANLGLRNSHTRPRPLSSDPSGPHRQ